MAGSSSKVVPGPLLGDTALLVEDDDVVGQRQVLRYRQIISARNDTRCQEPLTCVSNEYNGGAELLEQAFRADELVDNVPFCRYIERR